MKIFDTLFCDPTRLRKFTGVSGCCRVVGLAVIASMALAASRGTAVEDHSTPHYNAGGHVSLSLINLILERQILERQTVSDEIAGARTLAETTTRGRLRAEFVPSHDRAIVDFRMIGELSAPSATATRGSVTVRMASQTSIDARKRVVITGAGLFPAASQADCNTQTEILDVEATRRLIERLARRRAEKLRPEAQQSTSQQVAERVEAELDKQANDPLTGANQFYADKIRLPLVNAGSFPRDLRLSTTSTHLALRVLAQKNGQEEAPAQMPRLNPQYDIHVCGHQSMVSNMSEPLVGGKTFSDKQFLDVMKIMTGTAQRGLWVFDGRDRWNVTFAHKRPIQAVFANGTFRLTYHFQGATCGDDTVQGAIEASALYRPMMSADGVYLVRESIPTIRYTDGLPDDAPRVRVLQQLSQRFGAFFQEAIYFDGLSPPAGGTYAKLRELKLVELKCEDGWFSIGYELNRPAKVAIQP